MELHVVIDTKGNGRLVGVFDSRQRADELVAVAPLYYKLHTCQLDRINPEVLDWVEGPEQAQALKRLMGS